MKDKLNETIEHINKRISKLRDDEAMYFKNKNYEKSTQSLMIIRELIDIRYQLKLLLLDKDCN